MNNETQTDAASKKLTNMLRETYIPLIVQSLPEGPKQGEMRWLVNKCGTQYNRIKQHGKQPVTASLKITPEVAHPLGENRWGGRYTNSRNGSVYFISFEVL